MEKVGCSNLKNKSYGEYKEKGIVYTEKTYYNCTFDSITEISFGVTIGYKTSERTFADPYSFGFGKGNTHCGATFYESGAGGNYSCRQDSCLLKGWGH